MTEKKLTKTATDRVMTFYNKVERRCPTLCQLGRNLSKLSLEGKLDAVYDRDATVENIFKILLRKSKANVLLTGPAGCGKTAIAERTATLLANRSIEWAKQKILLEEEFKIAHKMWEKDVEYDEYDGEPNLLEPTLDIPSAPHLSEIVLFELSTTSLVSGQRYIGDMEKRVETILKELRETPNVVLFIDEIHTLVGCGQGEHNSGAEQMFKPALARREMRVIGATTTDEAEKIWKDKALARRFNEIKVEPLRGTVALETAKSILTDYAKYHEIAVDLAHTAEILGKLGTFLPKSVFPDNFINVVDEALASAKFDGLTAVDMTHYNAVIGRMAGVVIV